MCGLQKEGWVVLFLYVLFAFRTEAAGYNATSIEPVTNGGRIAFSELIEVFELKKNRDSQFFCPYLIEAGFGDLLGSNSKPSTCARNSLIAFDWFSAECSVTSNEWAIIERDVSIYGYVTGSALARINPWYVPHYVSISVTHWLKNWSHELVGKHEMGFLIPKHDIQLVLHNFQLAIKNLILRPAHASSNESQSRNSPSSSSGAERSPISGSLFLFLGAGLLKIAFYIFDGPQDSRWFRLLGGLCGIVSAYLIFQGTCLILTGNLGF